MTIVKSNRVEKEGTNSGSQNRDQKMDFTSSPLPPFKKKLWRRIEVLGKYANTTLISKLINGLGNTQY